MQREIELNLKLRDGATRILSIAANSIQRLDAAKTILVSNARLMVAMCNLQQEKVREATRIGVEGQTPNKPAKNLNCGKATLCLSGEPKVS